jgi:peptidoglycan/xylan/chitin deacetylase (PgdA/CDA1 family)
VVALLPVLFVVAGWAGYACSADDVHVVAGPRHVAGRQALGLGPAPPVKAVPADVELPVLLGPRDGPGGTVTRLDGMQVALTFDDGPDPARTPRLLDLLAAVGAKATFCVVGKSVAAHPWVVARIVAEGHTLCNHSWSHRHDLGRQSEADIARELRDTTAAIQAAAPGAPVPYFRAPGGNFTDRLVAVAAAQGMTSLQWTMDTEDWNNAAYPRGSTMINHVIGVVQQYTAPGMIILSHDGGRSDTITAYDTLLPWLSDRFTLVALPR